MMHLTFESWPFDFDPYQLLENSLERVPVHSAEVVVDQDAAIVRCKEDI